MVAGGNIAAAANIDPPYSPYSVNVHINYYNYGCLMGPREFSRF